MDKSYCVFGDSVTQAAYVDVGWVDLLRKHLEGTYKEDLINVFNLGIGGDTTGDMLKRFSNEVVSRNPTAIIFAVGINDTKAHDPKRFENNMKELIKQAKEYTTDIACIGLVLGDWKGTDPFSTDRTTHYNHILEEVVHVEGCRFIPLQGKLDAIDFQDGLHPNEQGHRKMFEVIKNYF